MIGYIKGKIISLTNEYALIETAGGLGFEVMCSYAAFSSLAGKKEGELFTYMQVTENAVALYGFASQEEKNMFLQLITVSGVGPKIGIAILSGLNVTELVTAIATSDVKKLSAVKGLGKKMAERIILELREKVAKGFDGAASDNSAISAPASSGDEDAVVALMTLGFSRAESEKAIARARASGAQTVEDIIMSALRGM